MPRDTRRRSLALASTVLSVAACEAVHVPVTPVPRGDTDDTMVTIAAGAFMMGCNQTFDSECETDELPYHEVAVPTFRIDRTEVTAEAYQTCIASGVCSPPATIDATCPWDPATRGAFPVTCVEHAQAVTYCASLGKRLPTEAEWERAARGLDGRIYPWGNQLPDCTLALSSECGAEPAPVGSLPAGATATGVLDMAGNIAEWVADWYDAAYYATFPNDNPLGPDSGTGRSLRGGAFFFDRSKLRTSNRGAQDPVEERFSVGFRCAADAS